MNSISMPKKAMYVYEGKSKSAASKHMYDCEGLPLWLVCGMLSVILIISVIGENWQ